MNATGEEVTKAEEPPPLPGSAFRCDPPSPPPCGDPLEIYQIATAVELQPVVCKHWKSKGRCKFLDRCRFGHPLVLRGAETDSFERERYWRGRRRKVHKAGRAASLASFLVDALGTETLRNGAGVLDVAGGAGEVSFQLSNLFGVPSAIVDPRAPKLYGCVRRYEMGMYQSGRWGGNGGQDAVCGRRRVDALGRVDHIPLFVCAELLKLIVSEIQNEGRSDGQRVKYQLSSLIGGNSRSTPTAANHEEEVTNEGNDVETKGDSENNLCDSVADKERRLRLADDCVQTLWDPSVVLDRLKNCSCIVGMHPDQGTEFVIDLALALGRPFAVVPCCVFGKHFPNRRLRDGTLVGNSYERFLLYLMEKDPKGEIKRATLDFGGKNQVLYHLASCSFGENVQRLAHA